MKPDTFGSNKADIVLAEHLTAHPEQATWSSRCIAKTDRLIHDLKAACIKDIKFRGTVLSYIKCAMRKHVLAPPPHIDSKTATYTANIVSRKLAQATEWHRELRTAQRAKG